MRDDLVRQLGAAAGTRWDGENRPMLAEEVRRLARSPLAEIGAHSVHHLSLADHDRELMAREAFESRAALEQVIGRSVTSFAYPFGRWSPDALLAVQSAAYGRAVTADPRPVGEGDRPWLTPRPQNV